MDNKITRICFSDNFELGLLIPSPGYNLIYTKYKL